MRATSWFLTGALLLILLDIGWERERRERPDRTTAGVDAGEVQALDGSNGEPPPPKP